MSWLNMFNRSLTYNTRLPSPLPHAHSQDQEMFILVDLINDDGNKVPTIEPITLIDCLSIYTSYMDTPDAIMPKTPSNTPASSSTPKSSAACIYDNRRCLWDTPPSELDILAGLTNVSSFSSLVTTPILTESVEDIDNMLPTVESVDDPMPQHKVRSAYCTSLTPMLLHGGIPITFMIMAQMGIKPFTNTDTKGGKDHPILHQ